MVHPHKVTDTVLVVMLYGLLVGLCFNIGTRQLMANAYNNPSTHSLHSHFALVKGLRHYAPQSKLLLESYVASTVLV